MNSKENAFSRLSGQLIEEFSATRPIHANSLLLSIYGDTICPHGGTLWLGSLIKLVEPLGINQRLVRTSVFRLSEKGILQSQQSGRRSYYTLTGRGLRQFHSASKRIYAAGNPDWDGDWRMVITSLGGLNPEQREIVRKELIWLGFSRLLPGIYVHPGAEMEVVRKMLEDRQLAGQVVMLHASDPAQVTNSNQLIRQCFDTHQMDEQYQAFVTTFKPILEAAAKARVLNPQLSFLIRTLLIHKYRHILLKEPELPHELLPEDVMANQARAITRQLYLQLRSPSDKYFLQVAETKSNTGIKPPDNVYYQRFESPEGRSV